MRLAMFIAVADGSGDASVALLLARNGMAATAAILQTCVVSRRCSKRWRFVLPPASKHMIPRRSHLKPPLLGGISVKFDQLAGDAAQIPTSAAR